MKGDLPAGRLLRHRAGVAGVAITTLFLVLSVAGPALVSEQPLQTNFRAILKPPSWTHWFGTDELGRDVLSRVVHGARTSLELVLTAVIGALLAGGGLGIWAGFRGGGVEMVTMRAIDLLLALPGFLIALVAITILGVGTVNLIIAVAIYSVPAFARIGHAAALSLRPVEFVQAGCHRRPRPRAARASQCHVTAVRAGKSPYGHRASPCLEPELSRPRRPTAHA